MPGSYGNPGPSSGSSMYDDSEPGESQSPDKGPDEKEDQGEQVFTVPKSAFGGKEPKPGEQYYFDVKSVHDDEVVMAYSTDEKEEKTEEAPADIPEMGGGADAGMAGMME